jgi:hypothetical protein
MALTKDKISLKELKDLTEQLVLRDEELLTAHKKNLAFIKNIENLIAQEKERINSFQNNYVSKKQLLEQYELFFINILTAIDQQTK